MSVGGWVYGPGEWWMGFGAARRGGGFRRWRGRVGGDGLLGRRGSRPDVVVRWESGPVQEVVGYLIRVLSLSCSGFVRTGLAGWTAQD